LRLTWIGVERRVGVGRDGRRFLILIFVDVVAHPVERRRGGRDGRKIGGGLRDPEHVGAKGILKKEERLTILPA